MMSYLNLAKIFWLSCAKVFRYVFGKCGISQAAGTYRTQHLSPFAFYFMNTSR